MGRGTLVFKGDVKKKKKKSKQKLASSFETSTSQGGVQQGEHLSVKEGAAASGPTQGTGKISTSGTVVTGHGTDFCSELEIGDAILVQQPKGGASEMRVVTMLLSSTSMNLSSELSKNVAIPVSFTYISKPRDLSSAKRAAAKVKEDQEKQEEAHSFGTYRSGGDVVVYRERTEHGNYRIKHDKIKKTGNTVKRSDLLALRTKKTSDKYC